jgi:hypothetical protein
MGAVAFPLVVGTLWAVVICYRGKSSGEADTLIYTSTPRQPTGCCGITTGYWIILLALIFIGAAIGGICGWYAPESAFMDLICGLPH